MSRPRISDEKYKLRGRIRKRKPAPGTEPSPDFLMAISSLESLEAARDASEKGSPERIRLMRAIRAAKSNICKLALESPEKVATPRAPKKRMDAFEQWQYDFRHCYAGSEYDPEKCK